MRGHPQTHDANPAGGHNQFGDLPEWDLSDLYPSPDGPEITKDMDWLDTACADFANDYEGKLAGLDADEFLNAIHRHEKIENVAGRIMSFAGLRYYQNTTDADRGKFMSDCQDKITNYTTPLVFFTLELNRLEDDHLEKLLKKNGDLARFKPIFDRLRAMRPHQLSDELEQFLHDQSVVGSSAWNKLFDETMAALEFQIGDETLNLEATLNLLTEQDRSKREAATHALADVFQENIKIFARVHNTLAKEKEIEDRWRKMPTPLSSPPRPPSPGFSTFAAAMLCVPNVLNVGGYSLPFGAYFINPEVIP